MLILQICVYLQSVAPGSNVTAATLMRRMKPSVEVNKLQKKKPWASDLAYAKTDTYNAVV